ncbi:MAG: cytochrome b/b6 domain-containing protein [Candidatus Neomarinimicrobiota bacterium]
MDIEKDFKSILINSSRFIGVIFFLFFQLSGQEIDSESCLDCHADTGLDQSIHADLDCLDCHTKILELGSDHTEGYTTNCEDVCESCGSCHTDAEAEFKNSIHGQSLFKKGSDQEAASCYSCHGSHNILPSDETQSLVYPSNLPGTCGTCHLSSKIVEKYDIPDIRPVEHYSNSIHNQKLIADLSAATCNDCHGVHDIKNNLDPTSSISHANISKTCGKCHDAIFDEYEASVHWQALQRGQRESPACIDCHGEHAILSINSDSPETVKRSEAEKTCAKCHTNQRLIEKYGLISGKVSSYQDSYHGLAVLNGDEKAATCYNCHNAHEILAVENENSSINPANLKNTCSQCHPGSTYNFAQSYTHQSVIMAERPVEYYVKIIYIYLIVLTVGAMILHNMIIFVHYLRAKAKKEREVDYIQRYSKSEVYQHFALIISFFTLVITGFALKYTDVFWVRGLSQLGLSEPLRGLIHRLAAIIMILISAWHLLGYFTRNGKQFLKEFIPGTGDFKGLINQMKFALYGSQEKPAFGRFDYTEKLEYWALIWGTVIMIVSGLILWFPVAFSQNSPVWLIKVAETFHLYEAWLATLAIFIWHFFFVIFHPGEYPASMTWLNGRMTVDEYKHKHALDFKNIMAEIESFKKGEIKITKLSFQAREYIIRHSIN